MIPASVIALLGRQTTAVGLSSSDVESGRLCRGVSIRIFMLDTRELFGKSRGQVTNDPRERTVIIVFDAGLDAKIYRLGWLIMTRRNANGNPIESV